MKAPPSFSKYEKLTGELIPCKGAFAAYPRCAPVFHNPLDRGYLPCAAAMRRREEVIKITLPLPVSDSVQGKPQGKRRLCKKGYKGGDSHERF